MHFRALVTIDTNITKPVLEIKTTNQWMDKKVSSISK